MLLFAHISYFFCLSAKLIFLSLFPSMDFTYLHSNVWLYSSITNKPWMGYVYNSVYLCSREPCIPKINTIAFTAVAFYEPQTLGSWIRNPSTAQILILLLVVFAVSLYAHFVIGVIQEITSALGIYCFRYQTCQFHYQVLFLSLFLHFSSYRFIKQIVPLDLEWF